MELARCGTDVAFCDVCDPESAAGTLSAIRQTGQSARYFRTSVADRPGLERLFTDMLHEFGHLDILVNNAAVSIRKPFLDLDVTDVQKVWDVALWGVFHCSQLAARQMVKQGGGSIVVISSVHAERAFPNSTAYNGAKAAVNNMARTWAAELAKDNVRVNVIEPGWIDTPGERSYFTDEQIREEGRKLPLGRLGKPEEIATAVRYLVSDEAAYITGIQLPLDAGFAVR